VANRDAIVASLDEYLAALQQVRALVAGADRDGLLDLLERARAARRNLPVGMPVGTELVELRVPVPDRPGVLAEVATVAFELGVNIVDFEVAHSAEGSSGVLVLGRARRRCRPVRSRAHRTRLSPLSGGDPVMDRLPSSRTLSVHGGSPLRGTVRVPGCKGVSHRALVAAAMADGESALANLATGEDVARTRAAVEAFGVATRESGRRSRRGRRSRHRRVARAGIRRRLR
jgi:hypothetical protein